MSCREDTNCGSQSKVCLAFFAGQRTCEERFPAGTLPSPRTAWFSLPRLLGDPSCSKSVTSIS